MQSRSRKLTLWVAGIILTPIVLYWLFANIVIKNVLESQLTQSHGAQVDIGDFDHSLFPLSITIVDVGFTDPAQPIRNQLVIGEMAGDVEWSGLLGGQIIMNQLSVLNVAFDQPRQSPGEVLEQPAGQSFDEMLTEAKEALPTVDELLERSPLKTTAAVQKAQQAYGNYAEELKSDYANLPDKEKLEYYKAQVKQLSETDYKDPQKLLQAKESFDALKQEIRKDKALISDFKEKASSAKQALSAALTELKEAPKQDYDLLKGVYAGDQAALAQLTEAVFGEKAAQYNKYLFAAFDVIVPMLKGGDAEEDDTTSDPMEVLIRQANVSVNWQDTVINGDWENITNAHSIFGNPTTFLLNTAKGSSKSFTTQGQFFIDENGLDANQTWEIAGFLLDSIQLSSNKRLDASIKEALLASSGALEIVDNALQGSGEVDLSKLAMAASGSDKITRTIADLLSSLTQLDMKMDIGGTLTSPDFGFSSDLDNQLAGAALSSLTASQKDKLNELNGRLQSMVAEQNDSLSTELGDISGLISASQSDEATLEELLQKTFKSTLDKQKDKLLNKLFKKADGR